MSLQNCLAAAGHRRYWFMHAPRTFGWNRIAPFRSLATFTQFLAWLTITSTNSLQLSLVTGLFLVYAPLASKSFNTSKIVSSNPIYPFFVVVVFATAFSIWLNVASLMPKLFSTSVNFSAARDNALWPIHLSTLRFPKRSVCSFFFRWQNGTLLFAATHISLLFSFLSL